jgi:hypothetical protein
MTETPFRDTATKIARTKNYVAMSYESGQVRSHGWWKNVVDYGPWKGPNGTRVGPPDPEALGGIAQLFGTSPDEVAAMVAVDWYGVHRDVDMSARAQRLAPILDELSESDADLVEALAQRLCKG